MIPLRDENPTVRTAYATMLLIGLNIAAWALAQGLGHGPLLLKSLCLYGLIPGHLLGMIPEGTQIPLGPDAACVLQGSGNLITPFTSMFMHGGWFHIIGNLWFLWIFGDNVEDAMGPVRFVIFYLLSGLAASAAQIVTNPGSAIPMVGASGAIGGVMGAYARLYPRAHVHTLLPLGFYFTTISVPAVFMLGYWFLIQVLGGIPSLASSGGGVAFWAHVGGFVAGLALVGLFQKPEYVRVIGRNDAFEPLGTVSVPRLSVRPADLSNPVHAEAVVALVDSYSTNPADGSAGLAPDVRRRLASALDRQPGAVIFLAFHDDDAVGVAVCFRGFSTFAARPLLNIHDLVVAEKVRGQGIGRALLERVERKAREQGYCKLTLEVMEDNTRARHLYREFGFRGDGTDSTFFLSKPL